VWVGSIGIRITLRTIFLRNGIFFRNLKLRYGFELAINTGCSYGEQFYLTHTSGVVYLLASAAGELFKGHSHRLVTVTAAVSSSYYLAAQTVHTARYADFSALSIFSPIKFESFI
jgi:hypothetical protein